MRATLTWREHRGQAAGVTALGVGVLDSGCVGYVDQPLFSLGTHVQVVLQELPQQLRPSTWSCSSRFRVRQSRRYPAVQPGHHRLEPFP
jgi:hypothetical protein